MRAGKLGGLVIRSLRLESFGGMETRSFTFDPTFVRLNGKEGKAVAAALRVILGCCDPPGVGENSRITADLEQSGKPYRVTAAWDGKAERFGYVIEPPSFPEAVPFLPCEEERELVCFQPRRDLTFADRLLQYRDPERFYGKGEFGRRTGGVGATPSFRASLRGYIDHFLPRRARDGVLLQADGRFVPENAGRLTGSEKERFELGCFLSVNAFWREVETVRDLNFAPPPLLILASEEVIAPYREELSSLGRQVFLVCEQGKYVCPKKGDRNEISERIE